MLGALAACLLGISGCASVSSRAQDTIEHYSGELDVCEVSGSNVEEPNHLIAQSGPPNGLIRVETADDHKSFRLRRPLMTHQEWDRFIAEIDALGIADDPMPQVEIAVQMKARIIASQAGRVDGAPGAGERRPPPVTRHTRPRLAFAEGLH